MKITTLSNREFNQDANVLKTADSQRPAGMHRKIRDALAMPGIEDVAFEIPRVTLGIRRADFS